MNLESLSIRPLSREELQISVGWAADEGWNPGLHDAEIFWETDPEGFLGAELNGELVATGSVVSYDRKYGFMGLFIVKAGLRGNGIGTRLWFHRRDHLRSRLESGAAIGMDGVFEMQDWYAEGGFKFSHRNLRMQGDAANIAGRGACEGIIEAAEVSTTELSSYDKTCFGCDRTDFLRRWTSMPDSHSLARVKDGKLSGYGVIRRCQEGHKIGPLYADSPEAAEALFTALCARVDRGPVWLDIPEQQPHAVELTKRHGMKEVFGCARMYYGDPPPMNWNTTYGITTFELG